MGSGDTLDGEGGTTVWGRLMPAADSQAIGALPIGLAQGRFSIIRNETDNPRVFQELDGLTLHSAPGAAKQASLVDPVQGMPLDLFLSRIRALSQPSEEQPNAH